MRKIACIFIVFLISNLSFSQKREKVKGSKIVTVEQKKVANFESLEVLDNLDVFLIKGNECGVEIEADDNLHDAIAITVTGNTLQISLLKDIASAKIVNVRVTYTSGFNLVTAREESVITALSSVELDNITFKSFDKSKLFLNAKTKNFTLECNDKSKAELNLSSEKATFVLSKSAALKALIVSNAIIFDMYQKSEAVIEGDVQEAKIRLDGNTRFTGFNFAIQNAGINMEGYSTMSVLVKNKAIIDAIGKSELQLFGDQQIEIKQFKDNAILMKKPLKI